MYPLRFEPIFRRYIWGGFGLRDQLLKETGDETAAESWEIVDHGEDQSIVMHGPHSGKSLRQLIADHGTELLGADLASQLVSDSIPVQLRNRFPLLLKFLDANRDLSIQVHPDDAFGSTLSPPDLGKTEAWIVMDAKPGAKIYAGLKEGVTEEAFRAAAASGETPSMMHSFEPKVGDCVFIKAGTQHAIGAGLLICEIQQASNTTFRIDDWGRVDADGNPRDLHIEQGIAATDFARGPVAAETPAADGEGVETLVTCDKFTICRHRTGESVNVGGDGRFRILTVIDGSVSIENDPADKELGRGETVLLPACLGATAVEPTGESEFLEIWA
ncbi:type I phosphomannose isomerase catalytic subunit [Mariniblastus fucicola]|uniref:Putative mannose-6-phosphate isomerase GmuF n=1 Tax=Mariniblastus fucicola TaxID=980251 RepID=A0A5B9PH90_9BACT|nr:type I phosphomannose isomerase catalytic subunit [Mariniblastus fucicola]QEG24625.1 putative mannose-6-phosphate isomerase GmuF [Mariniblastus fucicola]